MPKRNKKLCKYYYKDKEGFFCTGVPRSDLDLTDDSICDNCSQYQMKEEENRPLTHHELVEVAHRLLDHLRYKYIITEPGYRKELPDAIGFKTGESCLIECKASRADFLKDRKKPFRQDGKGVGKLRIYLTNPGVARIEEVPPKWQLAYALDKNTVVFQKPWSKMNMTVSTVEEHYFLEHKERDIEAEMELLMSWCYRETHNCLPGVPRTGTRFKMVWGDEPEWISSTLKSSPTGLCEFCLNKAKGCSRKPEVYEWSEDPWCSGYEGDLMYLYTGKKSDQA